MKEFIVIFLILLWTALGVGWIINLVDFIRLDFKPPYKAEIIRGIGVVTGLGGIVGWIPIQDN